MAQMLIRNLDKSLVDAFKRRAHANRTSLEEEARRALQRDAGFDYPAWRAEAEALAKRTGPLPGPDSTAMIRADRDRDNLR